MLEGTDLDKTRPPNDGGTVEPASYPAQILERMVLPNLFCEDSPILRNKIETAPPCPLGFQDTPGQRSISSLQDQISEAVSSTHNRPMEDARERYGSPK